VLFKEGIDLAHVALVTLQGIGIAQLAQLGIEGILDFLRSVIRRAGKRLRLLAEELLRFSKCFQGFFGVFVLLKPLLPAQGFGAPFSAVCYLIFNCSRRVLCRVAKRSVSVLGFLGR